MRYSLGMEIRYDKKTDIMVLVFTKNPVTESDEKKSGIIFDYDEHGGIVSMEILDASEKITEPEKVNMVFSKRQS